MCFCGIAGVACFLLLKTRLELHSILGIPRRYVQPCAMPLHILCPSRSLPPSCNSLSVYKASFQYSSAVAHDLINRKDKLIQWRCPLHAGSELCIPNFPALTTVSVFAHLEFCRQTSSPSSSSLCLRDSFGNSLPTFSVTLSHRGADLQSQGLFRFFAIWKFSSPYTSPDDTASSLWPSHPEHLCLFQHLNGIISKLIQISFCKDTGVTRKNNRHRPGFCCLDELALLSS